MSRKSVLNQIRGLPRDFSNNTRTYLFTSWTRDGIIEAARKIRNNYPHGRQIVTQKHRGATGMHGDLWWSFTAELPCGWVMANVGDSMADRYGMNRWVWTEEDSALEERIRTLPPVPPETVLGTPRPGRVVAVDGDGRLRFAALGIPDAHGHVVEVHFDE